MAMAGMTVSAPLMPGHGTSVEDMLDSRFDQWAACADAAFDALATLCDRVVVVGLSMGGTIASWLGVHRDDVAGLVLINPFIGSIPKDQRDALLAAIDAGETVVDGLGSDIAREDAVVLSYDKTPLVPLLSLVEAADQLAGRLQGIDCEVLLVSSRQDHLVPPANGDMIAAALGERCTRVWLEHSFHVATLDYDAPEVERLSVEFSAKVTGAPS